MAEAGIRKTKGAKRRPVALRFSPLSEKRGQALIIVLALISVLLALGLAFFAMSRLELRVATNVENTVRADLIAEGAVAMAMAFLNHDLAIHGTYTSLDHAWRSYFSGAWIYGKPWAFPGATTAHPLRHPIRDNAGILIDGERAVPQIDLDYMPPVQIAGVQRPIYTDKLTADLLYIPRRQLAYGVYPADPDRGPREFGPLRFFPDREPRYNADLYFDPSYAEDHHFVVSADIMWDGNVDYLVPAEQVHAWADVDNDEDGLRDSMWIPFPADKFFPSDGIDNDLDGVIDEGPDMLEDGRDNNLNGSVDEYAEFWDGIDNDLNGLIDEGPLMGSDGIDNDGDGDVDEPDERPTKDRRDNDGDGLVDEPGEEQPYEFPPIERGIFVYWGGDDQLDNDGDGDIDDAEEERLFLTAPLGPVEFDLDGDSLDEDPDYDYLPDLIVTYDPTPYDPDNGDEVDVTLDPNRGSANIDRLDNDHDFLINNRDEFTYDQDLNGDGTSEDLDWDGLPDDEWLHPAFWDRRVRNRYSAHLAKTFHEVNMPKYFPDLASLGVHLTATGEPVTEVLGRAAILIVDEASKVNMNVAGGHSFNDFPIAANDEGPIRRALNEGIGPQEYETRLLPEIGVARSNHLWTLLTGARAGIGFPVSMDTNVIAASQRILPDYGALAFDVSLPGYGRVDDDGNALWLAMNGLDDDGDAAFYQNDGIDNNLNNDAWLIDGIDNDGDGLVDETAATDLLGRDEGIDEPGEGVLVGVDEGLFPYDYDGDGDVEFASLEGLDEPQEHRQFRPLRNRLAEADGVDAEADGIDNDFDGFIDAADLDGEADNDADGAVDEIGEFGDRVLRTREQVKLVNGIGTTIFDRLKNVITPHSIDKNDRRHFAHRDGVPLPPLLREVSGLKVDYNVAPADVIASNIRQDFGYPARRLREIDSDDNGVFDENLEELVDEFALGLRLESADILWRRDQPGGMLHYRHDADGIRRFPLPKMAGYPQWQILGADPELRALQLAANVQDSRDSDHARTEVTTTITDEWWDGLRDLADDDLANDSAIREERPIEYTVSGTESIRINEIMVRPVRRIEAEAETDPTVAAPERNPNFFSAFLDIDGYRIADFDVAVRTVMEPNVSALGWAGINTAVAAWQLYPDPLFFYNEIGPGSFVGTVSATVDHDADPETRQVPNLIQFRFKSSPELPPGRYYLMVNTTTNGLGMTSTVTDPPTTAPQLRCVTKKAFESDPAVIEANFIERDIIDDVLGNFVTAAQLYTLSKQPVVGFENMNILIPGTESGWAFLGTTRRPNWKAPPGYKRDLAFTVEIPDFDDPVYPGKVLYVALWGRKASLTPLGGPNLAINFFDFSQEPDHEWVEIANIAESGDPVDLSGWELVVGAERIYQAAGIYEGRRMIMTIPPLTQIAPGGMLLLGVSKYDMLFSPSWFTGRDLIHENGIGLAGGVLPPPWPLPPPHLPPDLRQITVPPIPRPLFDLDGDGVAGLMLDLDADGNPDQAIESVFDRFNVIEGLYRLTDFVDRNGDGLRDGDIDLNGDGVPEIDFDGDGILDGTVEDLVVSTFDIYQVNIGNKPWDRIVQLGLPPELRGINREDEIAKVVLSGGIFPNYPEHDRVDNDGDTVDLRNDAVDNDGDIFFDESTEGVDEGRFRRDTHLDADATNDLAVPGSYSDFPVRYASTLFDFDPVANFADYPLYLGTASSSGQTLDHPDWKEFVERRFFPGDNVVVTLYEGDASEGRVVDRVTYTERDVANRAIDDIMPTYLDTNDDGVADSQVRILRDDRYSSVWPDNTMGIDFYRSLERKHPAYPGDRFGTRHRWQATDGNYDDWAPSTSRWERSDVLDDLLNRLAPDMATDDLDNALICLYVHAFSGSPLRMNLSQRLMESPVHAADVDGDGRQFYQYPAVIERRWAYERARVRNRDYVSPGDLARVPHFHQQRGLLFRNIHDIEGINRRVEGGMTGDVIYRQDETVREVLLGQHSVRDIAAVTAGSSNTSLELSVARADFYPLHPRPASLGGDFTEAEMEAAMTFWPQAWAPLFLYRLDTTGGEDQDDLDYQVVNASGWQLPIQYNFLFNMPVPASPPPIPFNIPPTGLELADLFDRWPLMQRTVMYVSRNLPSFNPFTTNRAFLDTYAADARPAEALFVWDAGDGLPNGEYDAYIATGEDLSILYRADQAFGYFFDDLIGVGPEPHERLASLLGLEFMRLLGATPVRDMGVDIEFFTDKGQPDSMFTLVKTAQNDPGNLLDVLTFSNVLGESLDSFGFVSAVPGVDGLIHYGAVKVENNYLALRLRNWAAPNRLNRFSRVILTPRNRIPGRININTVQTRVFIDSLGKERLFNPLTGIPGVLAAYDPDQQEARAIDVEPRPELLADYLVPEDNPDEQAFMYPLLEPAPPVKTTYIGLLNSLTPLDNREMPPTADPPLGVANVEILDRARLITMSALQPHPVDDDRLVAWGRPEFVDGRYYVFPSDLIGRSYPWALEVGHLGVDILSRLEEEDVLFHVDARGAEFDEMVARFSRIANLITTRSDVFEIVVTAQSGHVSNQDENNDGRIDFRNDFIVTSEKKTRVVYER